MNKRVTTVPELINQIRSDAEVRDRYMRHFGMNREELIHYLSALHQTQLQEGGTYSVYSVPEDGVVKVHNQDLKRGEKVFADAAGTPVLLLRCGNPLTLGPSQPVASNEMQPFVVGTPSEMEREVAIVPEEMVPQESVAVLLPPSIAEVPILTTSPPPTGTQNIPIASGGGGAGPLAILGALGGAALLNTGGGGGGSAVPEPMTMLALGAGVAGVVARSRRKR